jgi:O-antigen ligase
MPATRHRPEWIKPALILGLCLALCAALLAILSVDVRRHMTMARGIESGLAENQPPLAVPRLGTNVALERYADDDAMLGAIGVLSDLGFGTVRQRFGWAELEPMRGAYRWHEWDRRLSLLYNYGFEIIAVLDSSPAWARADADAHNPWAPPADYADYAAFARAFAARYGEYITAYQVWDQPNIAPHWGAGPVDPAAYVEMLRVTAGAIRDADPDAIIIAGGLAPNLEPGGANMSDIAYLREMYRQGAAAHFDVLGAKAYGFWSGPEDRRVSPDVLNYSRLILLRREMVRHDDGHKSIWALESGWNALPDDWAGDPSPHGSDVAFVQAERMNRAIQRARHEWPWLGMQCILHLQPAAPPTDPLWGYALLNPNNEPRPLLRALRGESLLPGGYSTGAEIIAYEPIIYPGLTRHVAPYLNPGADSRVADLFFWGTDLVLHVAKGPSGGQIIISMDEAPQRDTIIDLYAETPRIDRVRLARMLPLAIYRVRVQAAAPDLAALHAVQVGHRPTYAAFWLGLYAGILVLAQLGVIAAHMGRRVPWHSMWAHVGGLWRRLPAALQWAWLLGAFAAVALAPTTPARLAAAALYGLGALARPDLALAVAVGAIPLAPLHTRLGPGSFSLLELAVLGAAVARVWDMLLSPADEASVDEASVDEASVDEASADETPADEGRPWWRRLPAWRPVPEDLVVIALVLVGVVAALAAEFRHVALRELRLVIIEPAILYLLVRTARDRRRLVRLADVLWISGVGVALYALAVYPLPGGVIEAEGVRRARAFYGSPNNLALVMGRMLPLGLAAALWGGGRRRWPYALGAAAVGATLVLTYSRAAWLLALPAMALALAWVWRRRATLWVVGLMAVALAALLLMGRAQRFTSLLDLSGGTTFLRISLWQAAWDMARTHPWLGVGPDNFLYHYGDYIRPGAEVDRWLSHPHNLALDFWLRLGAGGLAVLAVLLASLARRGQSALRRPPVDRVTALRLGLVVAVIGATAHGLVDSYYFVPELAHWLLFALAWLVAFSRTDTPVRD